MKHFTFVRNIFTWTRKKKPAITEQLQRHKKKPYTYAKSIISTNRWPYVVVVVTFFPYLPECCVFFFLCVVSSYSRIVCLLSKKQKQKTYKDNKISVLSSYWTTAWNCCCPPRYVDIVHRLQWTTWTNHRPSKSPTRIIIWTRNYCHKCTNWCEIVKFPVAKYDNNKKKKVWKFRRRKRRNRKVKYNTNKQTVRHKTHRYITYK